jgi:hypothetical protein
MSKSVEGSDWANPIELNSNNAIRPALMDNNKGRLKFMPVHSFVIN